MNNCTICHSTDIQTQFEWHHKCHHCGLEFSDLDLDQYNGVHKIGWDAASEKFLTRLRLDNAARILSALGKYRTLHNMTLLDVGCAAGWLLKSARQLGVNATGIEPDQSISAAVKSEGFQVKNGFFPECLSADEKYDCISFNDVFEHLKDPHRVLQSCRDHLYSQGYLILNLPNSRGFFYRLSGLLLRFNVNGHFNRLWQKGYESPHLYYYNEENLKTLLTQHDFKLVHEGVLPSIDIPGLWGRIRESEINRILAIFIYSGILLAYPLIRYILPSDIFYHIYQKQ